MEEIRTSNKKPIIERIAIILAFTLIFVGLLFIAFKLYFKLPHSEYYSHSTVSFEIPGTNDGFIAQGLTYSAEDRQYLVSGYMKDGSPSPVILVGEDDKSSKSVYFTLPNGEAYTGHGGGIALANGRLYLTGDTDACLYVFSYADICAAENGGYVKSCANPLKTAASETDYVGPAFVTRIGNYLLVGEFYREGDYPTLDSHKITTLAGDYTQALAVVFPLNAELATGVNPTPVAAITLPDQAQGLIAYNNRVYISTSWGLSRSHILTYDAAVAAGSYQNKEINLLGTSLPLYALDSASLIKDTEIPPMSEELLVHNQRLHVMCESASDKYIFGKFTDGEFCYGTELSFFEPQSQEKP